MAWYLLDQLVFHSHSWVIPTFTYNIYIYTYGIQPISAQATTIFNMSLNMAADIILSLPKRSATCIEMIEMQHRNNSVRTFKSTGHRLHSPMSHLVLTNHRMCLLCCLKILKEVVTTGLRAMLNQFPAMPSQSLALSESWCLVGRKRSLKEWKGGTSWQQSGKFFLDAKSCWERKKDRGRLMSTGPFKPEQSNPDVWKRWVKDVVYKSYE